MVDTHGLGPCSERNVGSIPSSGTNLEIARSYDLLLARVWRFDSSSRHIYPNLERAAWWARFSRVSSKGSSTVSSSYFTSNAFLISQSVR